MVAPRWRRRLRTGARVRREVGLLGVAVLGLQRLEPAVGVHAEWFVLVEGVAPPGGGPSQPAPGVRWAGLDDLALLRGFGHGEDVLQSRLARGDRVAVVESGGELIAYAWYRGGAYDEQGVLFELGDGEAWLYDGMVAECHRGRRVWSALFRAAAAGLAAQGVTRVVSAIDVLNRSSLRAARARGATTIGSVAMARWLGVSVRREAWGDGRARWRVYRGALPATLPPAR